MLVNPPRHFLASGAPPLLEFIQAPLEPSIFHASHSPILVPVFLCHPHSAARHLLCSELKSEAVRALGSSATVGGQTVIRVTVGKPASVAGPHHLEKVPVAIGPLSHQARAVCGMQVACMPPPVIWGAIALAGAAQENNQPIMKVATVVHDWPRKPDSVEGV